MRRLRCAEVWGGIRDQDEDLESAAIRASLYAGSCQGGEGGDIYYLSVCGQDRLTRIAIADVAGHGPAVADVSRWLYEALEARVNDVACDAVLADLNALASRRGVEAVTTAAVAGFYSSDEKLYYAYAGHFPLLVHRRGTPGWKAASISPQRARFVNAPLGVLHDADFDQETEPIAAGDRVFLYTDGVLDAPGPDGEPFGEDRLLAALDAHADAPLPELKSAVLTALRNHAGSALHRDDVTLVAVEVR